MKFVVGAAQVKEGVGAVQGLQGYEVGVAEAMTTEMQVVMLVGVPAGVGKQIVYPPLHR